MQAPVLDIPTCDDVFATHSLKAGRIIADLAPETVDYGRKVPLKDGTWHFPPRHVTDIMTNPGVFRARRVGVIITGGHVDPDRRPRITP